MKAIHILLLIIYTVIALGQIDQSFEKYSKFKVARIINQDSMQGKVLNHRIKSIQTNINLGKAMVGIGMVCHFGSIICRAIWFAGIMFQDRTIANLHFGPIGIMLFSAGTILTAGGFSFRAVNLGRRNTFYKNMNISYNSNLNIRFSLNKIGISYGF